MFYLLRSPAKLFLIVVVHKKINPFTLRVKPCMIQSFLTFDSVDNALKYDHSLESC